MSKNYTQLSVEQRYQIEALIKGKKRQKEIAQILGVHPSTISRELARNTPQGGVGSFTYWADNAQRRTQLRHRLKPKQARFSPQMKAVTREWLFYEKLSPELISVQGKMKYGNFVSHETIYKWIWSCKKSHRREDRKDRKLYLHLRHNPRRQKRGTRHDKRGNIPHRVMIDQRPKIVDKRVRLGDLEVDLMIGKMHGSAILVSLDRATLKVRLNKIKSKGSNEVKQALIRTYQDAHWLKTITFDNDSAFMQHHNIGKQLKARTYFTRPYTSQDKGSIENRIGVLRRFLPKSTDLSLVTSARLKQIESIVNNRPIRKFNYKTANQTFSEKIAFIS
jgi:IS30 family transposase